MVLVAMPLKLKRSPAEGEFLFEIDEEPTEECWTALGGAPFICAHRPFAGCAGQREAKPDGETARPRF
jgi:hypothetical protein